MPSTVVSPSVPSESNEPEPRVVAPSDSSWAGWAISSFTNKIGSANGDIEPTPNPSKTTGPEIARAASAPRPSKPDSSHESHKQVPRHVAQPLNRSMSDRPAPVVHNDEPEEGDEVFDAWGAMDDDEPDVDPFTAAVTSPEPSSPAPQASPAPYEDGEPDFAAWLAAKSNTKAKKTLPKGLNKAGSTNSVATRSTTAKPQTVAPAKKIDIKPKHEEVDDDWGDAWD